MRKQFSFRSLSVVLILLCSHTLVAQFPFNENFKNSTSPGIIVSGAAKLTAQAGIDPAGQGYLRLNENLTNSIGYAYGQNAFPSNYGLTISFEFFDWKTGATATNQADGMTFFLFDASVNAFRPGGTGGSLGYAQYYSTPGLAKGYLGISIDEFGNFSSASDGNKNGGPGQQRGSVAIRGPGNGKALTDYVYQTGVIASDPAYNAGFAGFTQRYPDPLTANYRKIKIVMTPGSSLGSTFGYKITVIMYKGGASLTPVTLINNFDYPFIAPPSMKFGLAASTGSITNYHEVRSMSIDVTNAGTLIQTSATNDAGASVCQGQQAIVDVTANDFSNNTGGSINKASVDLDPATTGQQTTFIDPAKGTYTADSNGIVTFIPVAGFNGNTSLDYTISDNYGVVSNIATLSLTASNNTGPALTLADPPAACAPALVDITSAAWKTVTTAGASYTYFNNLADANNGTNNISLLANAIVLPGTYYVRADLAGCRTIKPIKVAINPLPTIAFAGTDQTYCSSTGSQTATLLATNPDAGSGSWNQISGPSGATINYPNASTSPLTITQQGVYVFRWTVASGACAASTSDMQVSVGNTTSVAGIDQVLSNTNAIVLAANTALIGTGKWTLVSSPAGSVATINQVNNPLSTVQINKTGNYSFKWTTSNGGCSSSSVVAANVLSLSLLPVQLLSFHAKQKNDSVMLTWTTTSEINNAGFGIERSIDGRQFFQVKFVTAMGSPNTPYTYHYTDEIAGVHTNRLYYRLKQTDADGKEQYSKVNMINLTSHQPIQCWPNPLHNSLFVALSAVVAGGSELKVYNTGGRLLKTYRQPISTGYNLMQYNLDQIPGGPLFIKLTVPGAIYTEQLLKIK